MSNLLKANQSNSADKIDLSTTNLFYRTRLKNQMTLYLKGQKISTEQKKALGYSLFAGGKALRALLIYYSAQALKVPVHYLDNLALSVELAHTYSLIHDDLPCMDDDDFRRHRPSHHKMFPQAASVLTGDALQADAFSLIATDKYMNDFQKIFLLKKFSSILGSENLIQGQWLDLFSTYESIDELKTIHLKKTGQLFSFALSAAFCLSAPQVSEKALKPFWALGDLLGLAFQIQDDLIDAQGSFLQRGKLTSSDQDKGVLHFISRSEANQWLKDLHTQLSEQLTACYGQNSLLKQLIFGKVLTLDL